MIGTELSTKWNAVHILTSAAFSYRMDVEEKHEKNEENKKQTEASYHLDAFATFIELAEGNIRKESKGKKLQNIIGVIGPAYPFVT